MKKIYFLIVIILLFCCLSFSGNSNLKLKMMLVKNGTFKMGHVIELSKNYGFPAKIHTVYLDYDYYIGQYEVTFSGFDLFCEEVNKTKPYDFGNTRDNHPVVMVNWNYVIEYCNWLSKRNNYKPAYDNKGSLLDFNGNITFDISTVEGYRLPTEAEWEYAANGGHKNRFYYPYSGSSNLEEVAWYLKKIDSDIVKVKTYEVGQKKPNELGVYDMTGNVSEWCFDYFDKEFYEICILKIPLTLNPMFQELLEVGALGYRGNYVLFQQEQNSNKML